MHYSLNEYLSMMSSHKVGKINQKICCKTEVCEAIMTYEVRGSSQKPINIKYKLSESYLVRVK